MFSKPNRCNLSQKVLIDGRVRTKFEAVFCRVEIQKPYSEEPFLMSCVYSALYLVVSGIWPQSWMVWGLQSSQETGLGRKYHAGLLAEKGKVEKIDVCCSCSSSTDQFLPSWGRGVSHCNPSHHALIQALDSVVEIEVSHSVLLTLCFLGSFLKWWTELQH